MDETTCERFNKTVENFTNGCQESQWNENKGTENRGKASELWPLPADSCKYELGRTLPTLEFLCEASNQESDVREAEGISHTEAGRFKETDHEGETKKEIPLTYIKHYIHDTRQQSEDIHGRRLDCLNTSKTVNANGFDVERDTKGDCRIESEKYEDIQRSEYCPNRTRFAGMHLALGQLLRIGAVGSSTGTKWAPCKFVFPHFHVGSSGSHEPMHKMPEGGRLDESCRSRNSSPMVIEVIANEYERNLFASYVNHGYCEVSNLNCIKPGSNLDFYVNTVQEFGFSHIILIGKRDFGIIFLDCYGRIFILDMMTNVLWPLGDTFEESVSKPWTGKVAWDVDEDGTVFEVEFYGTINRNQEDPKPLKIEKTHKKIKSKNGKKGKRKKNNKNSTLF
ncbi:hypothetical protein C1645_744178 [Glomus cerebriforme]|uniref:Uncharacterized protein n=1 Tax=Glomus cerebriforme TaxID=658196 RepID=A0A397SB13_9GLOM|nr:hypothetical protein C1645_744178 [Glomus cerebriforme]